MKLLLLLALFIPTGTVPTPAVARLCVNRVVPRSEVKIAIMQANAEGCEDVRYVKVDPDHYLVYGVKVLIGESKRNAVGVPLDGQ
jgi:predicted GH43/DUF377 family glycosyl hydrolase